MNRPTFAQIPMLWEPDGSLRDVYLADISAEGWSKFIQYASAHPFTYKADGEDADFPGVAEVFRLRDRSHCLSIWVGDATANCHFVLDDEIELDLDPREVLGPNEHNSLLDFIEGAALAVGVNASVTPEGSQNSPFMAFDVQERGWRIFG
ncbi:hypothetical protein [Pseudoduganella namucuonensis]|uniref:hypothetical protein n=1 Tax=Pseudoduganella namucuonensis TaxID=1035707 RepID=UPI00116053E7|nr:hypothetical protein [Pseudoduganella namucuonensis]